MWLDSDCVRVVFKYLWPQCPVKNTTPNHSFEFLEAYEIFSNDNKLHSHNVFLILYVIK